MSNTTLPADVGAKLTAARVAAGYSKYRLACDADVSTQQLGQWERGEHLPTPDTLLKLIPYIGGTLEGYLRDP